MTTGNTIEIKQRKNCSGCRCYALNQCELGYLLKTDRIFKGIILSSKPIEPCPKPITISQYFESRKYKK